MKKIILSFVLLMATLSKIFAQWECPSQLGAYLKPIGSSDLMWALESADDVGYLTNNKLFSTMNLLGLDYSTSHHTLYLEGGFKYWYRVDEEYKVNYYNSHFGFREAFYNYRGEKSSLKLGLQTMNLEESYLLNERVFGLNYKRSLANWSFNLLGGTVTKDFARNGTFCNVSYLYDIIPNRERSLLGETFGQTNLMAATLTYNFSKQNSGLDEFATDSVLPKKSSVESLGLVVYDEFGDWIPNQAILSGFYSTIKLANEIFIQPEILFQSAKNNAALIYSLKVDKTFTWHNEHRSNFMARYIGLTAIDKNATAQNSFSNIFSGSVLRLDALDLPFYQASIKHTIPAIQTHLKLQATGQFKSNPMQEYDIELGKKFFNHLLINGLYAYVISPALTKNANLFRLELRFYL